MGEKHNEKVRNTVIILVVLFSTFLILVFPLPDGGILRNFFSQLYYGKGYTTNNVDEYGNFEMFNGYSALSIFPENIQRDDIEDYYYSYQDIIFDPTAQIYLECNYDSDTYMKEITRLENIKVTYKEKVQHIQYDNKEHFNYPAYVTILAENHCYEYALLLGENSIAYIFLQFVPEEEIKFTDKYLPNNYERENDGYSIYLFDNGRGGKVTDAY